MKFRVATCRRCGQDEFAVGAMSRKGLCEVCGNTVAVEHALQMARKAGTAWDHWLDQMQGFIDRQREGEGG